MRPTIFPLLLTLLFAVLRSPLPGLRPPLSRFRERGHGLRLMENIENEFGPCEKPPAEGYGAQTTCPFSLGGRLFYPIAILFCSPAPTLLRSSAPTLSRFSTRTNTS